MIGGERSRDLGAHLPLVQGYYDYPDCKPCPCFPEGTLEDGSSGLPVCVIEDEVGSDLQCPCRENYSGAFCDECAPGYYNFPDCVRKLKKIMVLKIFYILSLYIVK